MRHCVSTTSTKAGWSATAATRVPCRVVNATLHRVRARSQLDFRANPRSSSSRSSPDPAVHKRDPEEPFPSRGYFLPTVPAALAFLVFAEPLSCAMLPRRKECRLIRAANARDDNDGSGSIPRATA